MEINNSTSFNGMEFEMIDEEPIVDVGRLGANDMDSNEAVRNTIKHFLHKFANLYSVPGPLPVSFLGSLDEALNYSLFEPTLPRPLVLYLHHSQSIAVNIFCQNVLCTETITDFLSEEFLIWTWDRTRDDDYSALLSMLCKYTTDDVVSTVSLYPVDAYPLLVCLSVHQGQIDVVCVIEGTMSKAETIAQIIESRKKFDRRSELSHLKPVRTNLISNQNQSVSTSLLKPLVERSLTIKKITEDFKKSYMEIVRIDQVENATWLSPYLAQKTIIDTRVGHNQNEHLLFHGCPRSAAEKIIRRGFDHNLIGMHGGSYGYGFYFSSDQLISHHYAIPDLVNDNERTMLVCRVLVGQTCQGNSTIRKCPNGYDSSTDGSKTYVVYSNEQILPEYIITYKENYNIHEEIPIRYMNSGSSSGLCTLS